MIRVTHLIGDLKAGGAQKTLLRVVRGLDDGFRHAIVTWRDGPEDGVFRAVLPEHVDTWHIPRRGERDLGWLFRVADLMRQNPGHVTHGWRNSASFWAVSLARLTGSRRIVTSQLTQRDSKLRREIHRLGHAAVTDSHAVYAHLPEAKRVLIPPGIEPPTDGPTAELDGRVILNVGGLCQDKDQAALIGHARRNPSDHLVLVGPDLEPEYARRLRENAPENVSFEGSQLDVGPYYRRADLFVLTSRTESCPNALIEAMSYGVPLIATRVGDVPIILADGDHGLLIDPFDDKALNKALKRPPVPPSPAAAVERFGLEAMLDGYRTLYRRLS